MEQALNISLFVGRTYKAGFTGVLSTIVQIIFFSLFEQIDCRIRNI